jgi:anti-sigma factor RsiW
VTDAPLSCQDIVELVTEYLEDSLPSERRLGFEEHIAICPPCRNYFGQFRHTVQLGRRIREDELPQDVRTALVDVFRDWRKDSG